MSHEIDMKKYNIRTDLAIDVVNNGFKKRITHDSGLVVSTINLDNASGKKIGKKEGIYITIEFGDVTDTSNLENVTKIFAKELSRLLKSIGITKNMSGLVIGLGNKNSTPDALGPLTIKDILVTRHLLILSEMEKGFRNISALSPGVMGETGIESIDIVLSLTKKIKPDFVIVVDALASSSIKRVNKTIQMTNTGIQPGSGIGNSRKEISKKTLGIPVISIGVPTVVSAFTIVKDTLDYLINSIEKPKLRNSIKKIADEMGNVMITTDEYNFIVTPKEEDYLIKRLSEILSLGINKSLHDKVQ